MPTKELENITVYRDGQPLIGIGECELPEIERGSGNEMPDMRKISGQFSFRLQRVYVKGSRARAGKANKEHSKHFKYFGFHRYQYKKRYGKSARNCRRIGGL